MKNRSFVKKSPAMNNNKQPIFPQYPRIAVDPKVCTGRPHIAGTRITVSAILANMAGGMDIPAMLKEFPRLKEADILQALAFASSQLQDQFYPIRSASWSGISTGTWAFLRSSSSP